MATVPSLALIPSAYKASKVYSVIPSNGDGDFTFTRNSSATRVNSNGLIETVGVNVPRLDYSDGNCPSLLLEPQRTNLLTYSEDFSNASWADADITVLSNALISPNGLLNSDEIIEGTVNSEHYVFKVVTIPENTDYTISCFFKKGVSNDYVYLRGRAKTGLNIRAWYNISNGTIGTVDNGATAKIEDYGNGWFRCYMTINSLTGASSTLALFGLADSDNSFSYIGDGVSSSYFWGAQAEEGYPTSYIPTNGSIATRIVETCNGAGNSTVINSEEGVLFAEISGLQNGGSNRTISISNGSSNNRMYINLSNTSSNWSCVITVNGVSQGNLSVSNINHAQNNKIALKYKENDFAFWINGVERSSDLSGSTYPIGTLNQIDFDFSTGSLPFFGKVKQLQYFDTALTDTELQELTTL